MRAGRGSSVDDPIATPSCSSGIRGSEPGLPTNFRLKVISLSYLRLRPSQVNIWSKNNIYVVTRHQCAHNFGFFAISDCAPADASPNRMPTPRQVLPHWVCHRQFTKKDRYHPMLSNSNFSWPDSAGSLSRQPRNVISNGTLRSNSKPNHTLTWMLIDPVCISCKIGFRL